LNDKDGIITYCNTGHWASTAWFALSEIANQPNVKNYDGSMTDWTSDPNREVIKG
jgi:thiosulfate/3-mercaptopyruvate sulfurtransferase